MKILVTGRSGQLSDEFYHDRVKGISFTNIDITDQESIRNEILNRMPDFIINCAAMTNVPACEVNREKAWNVNAIGPKNIALAAAEIGARVIQISTDYVFSGYDVNQTKGYDENDAPTPINHYGYTKREGEIWVLRINPCNIVIRTSWLIGIHGHNGNFLSKLYSNRMDQIKERPYEVPRFNIVDDVYGAPTSAKKLKDFIYHLLHHENLNDVKGIYHFSAGTFTTWYKLATEFFSQLGMNARVTPISSKDLNEKIVVNRPRYSFLANNRMPEFNETWNDHLKTYMDDQNEGVFK